MATGRYATGAGVSPPKRKQWFEIKFGMLVYMADGIMEAEVRQRERAWLVIVWSGCGMHCHMQIKGNAVELCSLFAVAHAP